MSQPTIVCVGEALVDFIPAQTGVALRRVDRFEKTVGGAPANVTVGLARQGQSVALLTRVGDDEFGHFLAESLDSEGVDTSRFHYDAQRRTGITFLQIDARGERSFLFFRQESAETAITPRDLDPAFIQAASIVHLGSNLMMREAGREATLETVRLAREANRLITVDPNLRVHMWSQPEDCYEAARLLCTKADVVKLNDEEAAVLTDQTAPAAAAAAIASWGPSLVIVTCGERGCLWRGAWSEGALPAPTVEVIDTTGAGDAFCAGMLAGIAEANQGSGGLDAANWNTILSHAVQMGSAAVTKLGATAGVPRRP